VVSSTPRPHFNPGKDPVLIVQEAGGPQDRSERVENLVPTGIRSQNVQPVAQSLSSTPRPHFNPGKDPVPILQQAGWAPGPFWTGGKSRPHRDSIPERPARSSVAIPTELPGPLGVCGVSKFIFELGLEMFDSRVISS